MSRVSAGTRGRQAGSAPPSPLATIWAVARYEITLQRRTPLLWAVATLLVAWVIPPLLWAPQADFPSLSPRNPTRWQDVFSFYNFTAIWCGLVAPLYALVVLSRDRDRRVTDLLWSRPLDVGTYVTGKALALALVLIPLSAASEALYWVLGSLRRGAPAPPLLLLVEWVGVALPVVLLAAAVVLALSLVPRHPAAALLSWWAGVFGVVYAEVQAISQEYGGPAPAAFPVHVGPYRLSADVDRYPVALIGGALIVLGAALGLLAVTPLLLRVRERASVLTRDSLLCMTGLACVALTFAVGGAMILHGTAGAVVR